MIQPLVIVNITPDSFSDGGLFDSVKSFKAKILYEVEKGFRNFDVGAQSTAPGKIEIDYKEEIKRYNNIFLKSFEDSSFLNIAKKCSFSIDTFRPNTFKEVLDSLLKLGFEENQIIWNDVSGVIDKSVFELLKEYNCKYIYSHSLLQERLLTPKHYKYELNLNNVEFLNHLISYFNSAREKFKSHGVMDRVIFDPCFGFSKNDHQNLIILENMENIFETNDPVLIGISRKRFIKNMSKSLGITEDLKFTESLHVALLTKTLCRFDSRKNAFFRIHDSQVFELIAKVFGNTKLSFQM